MGALECSRSDLSEILQMCKSERGSSRISLSFSHYLILSLETSCFLSNSGLILSRPLLLLVENRVPVKRIRETLVSRLHCKIKWIDAA